MLRSSRLDVRPPTPGGGAVLEPPPPPHQLPPPRGAPPRKKRRNKAGWRPPYIAGARPRGKNPVREKQGCRSVRRSSPRRSQRRPSKDALARLLSRTPELRKRVRGSRPNGRRRTSFVGLCVHDHRGEPVARATNRRTSSSEPLLRAPRATGSDPDELRHESTGQGRQKEPSRHFSRAKSTTWPVVSSSSAANGAHQRIGTEGGSPA